MCDGPKFLVGVVDNSNRLAGGGSDGIIMALEIDREIMIDSAQGAEGKVQIKQGGRGSRTKTGLVLEAGIFPDFAGDEPCGSLSGGILAFDFHLENGISLWPSLGSGMSQEGDKTFLEGAKAAFNFTFRLRSGSDQMSHAKTKEGALELAFRIAAVVGRTWAKEAKSIGIDSLWQAVSLKEATEVTKMVPSGFRFDESACQIEAGMVINGEQEDLFGEGRPPLVNRTVVLEKFPNPSTTKASIDPFFGWQARNQMSEVFFEMSFNTGAGTLETEEPQHFIGHKLVVGWVLERQKIFEKGVNLRRPSIGTSASTCLGEIGLFLSQKVGAQLVKTRFADPKMFCRKSCA